MSDTIITICIPLLTVILAVIGKFLVAYLSTKTLEEEENISTIITTDALDTVKSLAYQVITYLNETVVNDLKAKSEDGKLSADEIEEIRAQAVDQLKSILSENTITIIGEVIGDIDSYLMVLIQSVFNTTKDN